jgi:hypothetical protein
MKKPKTPHFNPGGHPGKLHREMGIPVGEPIPKARLRSAEHSHNPEVARDAKRAETMEHWNKTGPKHHRHMDGAGRHAHDMSHHEHHMTPKHPHGSHTKQGHDPVMDHGAYGYSGETLRMKHEGDQVGKSHTMDMMKPAVLKHDPGKHGWPGQHLGMGHQASGYGHTAGQRQGALRTSGHAHAHQVGKRK